MNENKDVFHTSALAGGPCRQGLPIRAWRLAFICQLWMLAAFVGMSLLAIAASTSLYRGGGHGARELLGMGLVGALVIVLSWRGFAGVLRRADQYELHSEPVLDAPQTPRSRLNTNPAPAQARMTGITPTW